MNTAMVMHVEQITPGSAAVECYCGAYAVMLITSEPDLEPGPVCAQHAWEWIDLTTSVLAQLFPRP
jgi:hypothetical protein